MTDINKTLSEIKSFVMSGAIAASYQSVEAYRKAAMSIAKKYTGVSADVIFNFSLCTDCSMREYRSKLLYEIKKIEESLK